MRVENSRKGSNFAAISRDPDGQSGCGLGRCPAHSVLGVFSAIVSYAITRAGTGGLGVCSEARSEWGSLA
ncbi:hypothetical protein EVAR_9151_1 [Eumeta japonica]|uniref:Uncharacterized protein n=1 Tax=Eumeta variegata TaxID=151549 RepID=A0A4C1TW75_EUMVA|nr:hypothetical protein EVAR_9151_1 [Eumeta japonica]